MLAQYLQKQIDFAPELLARCWGFAYRRRMYRCANSPAAVLLSRS
jgi:hypothetical protein